MRRYIVFVCFALLGFGFAMAAAVPRTVAAEVARHVFLSHHPDGLARVDVSSMHLQKWQHQPTIFAINFAQGGFVLLSADDRARPVLGVCYEGAFSPEVHVPALDWMMEEWSRQIAHIVRNDIAATPDIAREWATWRMSAFPSNASAAPACPLPVVVAPLLATTWNQGCYYNANCPTDGGGSCGRVWTGCGATAMAQSMKYYAWPATGTGTYSYTPPSYPLQAANYGATTYLWASMPNNVTAANPAVAQLMHQCGVALDMNYGTAESTCFFSALNDAMKKYFRYSLSTQGRGKIAYTDAQWDVLLRTELNAARIVPYNGGAHIWVCDGYQTGPDLYHMNWGWGGTYNGYFAQNSLNPGSLTFSTVGCLVGVKPVGKFEVAGDSTIFTEYAGTATVEVAGDSNWTAAASAAWITIAPITGTEGYSRPTISVTANPGYAQRNGYVAFQRGNYRDTIWVRQAGIVPRLSVSPTTIAEGAAGGVRTITVSSDSNWVVTFADVWIGFSPASGVGAGSVTITIAANPGAGARVGTITLVRGSITRTVTVNQDGTSAFWCVPALGLPTAVGATNVKIKTLNRTSGISEGYVLAPDSTILRLDSTYNIRVTFSGSVAPAIWIDWNQDGDFFDVAEAIVAPSGSWYPTFGGSKTTTVTVPATAMLGQTRMRVYVKTFSGGPTTGPCAITNVGDIEDYNVYVQSTPTLPINEFVLSLADADAGQQLQWTWGQPQAPQSFGILQENAGQMQEISQVTGNLGQWQSPDGLQPGRYQVEAHTWDGQRIRSNVVEVSALADAGHLSIAPNPVAMGGKFKLALPDVNGPITLRVMSATGQIVQAGELADVAECYLSTEGWAAGVYLVQVRLKGRMEQLRVVVR